jgi:hypothetical protein
MPRQGLNIYKLDPEDGETTSVTAFSSTTKDTGTRSWMQNEWFVVKRRKRNHIHCKTKHNAPMCYSYDVELVKIQYAE